MHVMTSLRVKSSQLNSGQKMPNPKFKARLVDFKIHQERYARFQKIQMLLREMKSQIRLLFWRVRLKRRGLCSNNTRICSRNLKDLTTDSQLIVIFFNLFFTFLIYLFLFWSFDYIHQFLVIKVYKKIFLFQAVPYVVQKTDLIISKMIIIVIFEFERRQFDWTNKLMNQNMHDFDNSLNLGFARSNIIGWHQVNEEVSQDASQLNRIRQNTNSFFMALPNEPPRPGNSLYSCIQSEQSEQSVIKEVPFMGAEHQNKMIKHVNSKQYFRMMKRRIKKGMQKILKGGDHDDQERKKKYLHQSRHKHALNRPRGKDGKFLATRPLQQRFREKKKRGRKPKNQKGQMPESISKINQSIKTETTPFKQSP